MKVHELIEMLQEFDPELPVVCLGNGFECECSTITNVELQRRHFYTADGSGVYGTVVGLDPR